MDLDVVMLSRLQFALTVGFHYLFPPLSIGLSWIMVLMEAAYVKTRNKQYESIARFLTGIFAVVFAVGVASGIVMEFQFGTNWAAYSRFVGDVFGSALAAEGIFAFFLESAFLAILVFGWERVSPRVHFLSTLMVALGALCSSIWIVVANSWQQTPAGHHLVQVMKDGAPWVLNGQPVMRAEIVDFWAVVFNPSTVSRLLHVWAGAGTLGAFFVLSVSAYYILKGRHLPLAHKMFKLALVVAFIMALGNLYTGDLSARVVAKHQPAKLAAMEGDFKTGEGGTKIYLWGFPSEKEERVLFGIGIPGGLSLLVHHNLTEPVTGLDRFPEADRPPVALTFYSFHIMVGLGFAFLGLTVFAILMWWRGTLFRQRWLLWIFVVAVLGPFITNEVGWVTAEVGRQPWIVYNLLRTADAVSPAVSSGKVLFSIVLFGLIYLFLFLVWVFILGAKIQKGPSLPPDSPPDSTAPGQSLRRVRDNGSGNNGRNAEQEG